MVILVTLAITPAVCEEFYFRGYLMGALQKAVRPATAIVVSALLFGAFHVIATSALSTERFLPSTFMGLILGWLCYRTQSVLPGMLLHATHNGLLLMVAYYKDELKSRGWGVEEQSHLPATWIGLCSGRCLCWCRSCPVIDPTPRVDLSNSQHGSLTDLSVAGAFKEPSVAESRLQRQSTGFWQAPR